MNRVGKKSWKYSFFPSRLEKLVCPRNNWYSLGNTGNLTSSLNASSSSSFCVLGLLASVGGCVLFPPKPISDRADVGVAPPPTWLPDDWLPMLDISWARYDSVYGNNWCHCLLVSLKFMISSDVYCKTHIKFTWLYHMFTNSSKYFSW